MPPPDPAKLIEMHDADRARVLVAEQLRQFASAVDMEEFANIETALSTASAHLVNGQGFFAGIDFARARRMVANIHDRETKAKANELCDAVYSAALQRMFCEATGLVPQIAKTATVSVVGECAGCGNHKKVFKEEIEVWSCADCSEDEREEGIG